MLSFDGEVIQHPGDKIEDSGCKLRAVHDSPDQDLTVSPDTDVINPLSVQNLLSHILHQSDPFPGSVVSGSACQGTPWAGVVGGGGG